MRVKRTIAALAALTVATLSGTAAADAVPQPPIQVAITTAPGARPAPGYFFLDPYQVVDKGSSGPMIIDSQGRVVWYHPLPAGVGASDFQVQTYEGKPVLTWWQGTSGNPAFGAISNLGIGQGEDVIMNSHYRIIRVLHGLPGLYPDAHEFQLTPQGDALVTAYNLVPNQPLTITEAGETIRAGSINVVDSHALVIDVKTGKVLLNWDALAHVPLTACELPPQNPWDYFHINSISLAPNGNLLISGRNVSAIYEVNPHIGAIVWQLGGKGGGSFTMGANTTFAYQHDPRFTSPTQISLFDDEAWNPFVSTTASRAEWLNLDFATHTATLARQIEKPTRQAESWSQGNVQPLSGGGVVVSWGSAGTFSEYSPSGSMTLLGQLPAGPLTIVDGIPVKDDWNSYRVFKQLWTGTPSTRPTIATAKSSTGRWVVSATWNGATLLRRWRVLSGRTRSRLKALATVPWNGLTTTISFTGRQLRYVAVEALGPRGRLRHGTSRVVKL